MLDFSGQGGQIKRQQLGQMRRHHVTMKCDDQLVLCAVYNEKLVLQHFILPMTTLET